MLTRDRPASRPSAGRGRWSSGSTYAALGLLVAVYLATVLINLDSDPILGGDEGWIMSASARLAEDGIFGSELFAGFYGAERHYFFNLPLHHLMLAGVFEVFGVGIVPARLLSAMFGLLALGLTYALGRRLGGEAVGVSAAALLILLRLNLTPLTGLTLTDLGATVRYDLVAVPYGLAAVLLIAMRPAVPSMRVVAVSGLLIGFAALTQFIGAFFFAPIAVYLLALTALPLVRRLALVAVLVLAAALPFLPYGVYAAAHWDDFRGQARAGDEETERSRSDVLSLSFYLRQLSDEPERYQLATGLEDAPSSLSDLVERPSARLALLVVAPVAAAYAVLRAARGSLQHRLFALLIVGLVLQLALFESTKRFVYFIADVPFLCIAIADLARAAWESRPGLALPRAVLRGVTVAVLLLFAVEGLAVAAQDVRDASDAPEYAALQLKLEAALPEGAVAMGDNRLWPALRDRDYRSLLLLFYFTNPAISKGEATNVFGAMERTGVDYLLLSPLSREILTQLSPRDAADFARFLEERAALETTVDFPIYGPIGVYRVER
jgi:4-amino-4-deoxy-L-arabinose transferase-like glycosyltransferase